MEESCELCYSHHLAYIRLGNCVFHRLLQLGIVYSTMGLKDFLSRSTIYIILDLGIENVFHHLHILDLGNCEMSQVTVYMLIGD